MRCLWFAEYISCSTFKGIAAGHSRIGGGYFAGFTGADDHIPEAYHPNDGMGVFHRPKGLQVYRATFDEQLIIGI